MDFSSHFSKKTIARLSKKGVSVIGLQSIPSDEGDVYFSAIAYILDAAGTQVIRSRSQVETMAVSSWSPSDLTDVCNDWD